MSILDAQQELDFESSAWVEARRLFYEIHARTEKRESLEVFLQDDATTVSTIERVCRENEQRADAKHAPIIGKILEKITIFKHAGDLAVKAAPESIGLAWTGVSLCLSAFEDEYTTFKLLAKACIDIIGILTTCRSSVRMFAMSAGLETMEEIRSQVVDGIPNLYVQILELSFEIKKYLQKGKIKGRWTKGILESNKGKFEAIINEIESGQTKIAAFATAAHQELVQHDMKSYHEQTTDLMRIHHKEVANILDQLKASVDASNATTSACLAKYLQSLEQQTPLELAQTNFKDRLRALDPSTSQVSSLQSRQKRPGNTCLWIFEDSMQDYRIWHDSQNSSLLWLSGPGGQCCEIIP
ncbi:hypothetical protein EJ08DRAFT_300122 [Tothia fuscella]|uniref:DUF7708 domain-containing protein n=1 Tax=Tothia fuscella TaxID=1048955 RepID=A0A9P4TXK8_9PEZI|nr:hypothetical protein EJ08DRAFT_300122 [Tothia fuscella]